MLNQASSGDQKAIRWDLTGLAEMAATADAKADTLLDLRAMALDAAEVGGGMPEMRKSVVVAQWGRHAAEDLRRRRLLLAIAEQSVAADLGVIGPIEMPGWKPELRSRPIEVVERELATALAAGAQATAAELTLEMAVAQRNTLLMAARPPLGTITQLQRLIDYLAYEIARARPRPTPNWINVTGIVDRIKTRLDESKLRDVRRADLLAINRELAELAANDLDAVILQLEDAQLYRWLRELDGIGGGNLTIDEETTLFHTIAQKAGAATIFRIASSERGAKFPEIALAVSTSAPIEVAIEFIELCAANAIDSDLALAAALSGLAALRPEARMVAYTALVRSGAAEQLGLATTAFLQTQIIERDDPLVVEFVEGVVAGLTGAAAAMWDLSGSLFVDSHTFREAWAGLGRTVALAGQDPIAFVAVVLDLDTLRRNPARWAGIGVTEVATLGIGKLARLGRLGSVAKAVAERLRQLGSKQVGINDLEVRAGHLTTSLDRLEVAADAIAVRELIERQQQVVDVTHQLEELPGKLPDLEVAAALYLVRTIGAAAQSLVDEIAGELTA